LPDREAVGSADLALERADDAGRDRPVVAERVADRDCRVADLDPCRVAERQRPELCVGRVDLQDGDVGGQVAADHLGVDQVPSLLEADRGRARPLDHVRVREDIAVGVEDEAGARRKSLLLEREAERRIGLGHDTGRDEDDARRGAAVDVGDAARLAVRVRERGSGCRDLPDHLAPRVSGVDRAGADQRRSERQHDKATRHPGDEIRGGGCCLGVGVRTGISAGVVPPA